MIDFSTLQGLTIPDGNVTQITDVSGRVIWAVSGGKAILEVEKITSDTYAGETTYTGEQFILLDIYPKTNGTVNVTYGGLTKTITDTSGAAEPNAQQVFFGTFNGVADSVATPASGELVIEGAFYTFGCSKYKSQNKNYNNATCSCITTVNEWGKITSIPPSAFDRCAKLSLTSLPETVTQIGDHAFNGCTSLALTKLPSGITSIGAYAFYGCTSLALTSLPSGITSIEGYTFWNCLALNIAALPEGLLSIGEEAFYMDTDKSGDMTMHGKTVTFPSTLTSIGGSAFRYRDYSGSGDYFYYTYLSGAVMLSKTPPTLGSDVFGHDGTYNNHDTKMVITVPRGCVEAYKAGEGWNSYTNRIVEAS